MGKKKRKRKAGMRILAAVMCLGMLAGNPQTGAAMAAHAAEQTESCHMGRSPTEEETQQKPEEPESQAESETELESEPAHGTESEPTPGTEPAADPTEETESKTAAEPESEIGAETEQEIGSETELESETETETAPLCPPALPRLTARASGFCFTLEGLEELFGDRECFDDFALRVSREEVAGQELEEIQRGLDGFKFRLTDAAVWEIGLTEKGEEILWDGELCLRLELPLKEQTAENVEPDMEGTEPDMKAGQQAGTKAGYILYDLNGEIPELLAKGDVSEAAGNGIQANIAHGGRFLLAFGTSDGGTEKTAESRIETTGDTYVKNGGKYELPYILGTFNAFVSGDYYGTHVVGPMIVGGNTQLNGSLGGTTQQGEGEDGTYRHAAPSYLRKKAWNRDCEGHKNVPRIMTGDPEMNVYLGMENADQNTGSTQVGTDCRKILFTDGYLDEGLDGGFGREAFQRRLEAAGKPWMESAADDGAGNKAEQTEITKQELDSAPEGTLTSGGVSGKGYRLYKECGRIMAELDAGGNYRFETFDGIDSIYYRYQDAEEMKNTITVIRTEQTGEVVLPKILKTVRDDVYGNNHQFSSIEKGPQFAVLYFAPNAERIFVGCKKSSAAEKTDTAFGWKPEQAADIKSNGGKLVGHLWAPGADVVLRGGDYSGCVVADDVDAAGSGAEGHMWPFREPDEKPEEKPDEDRQILTVQKRWQDGNGEPLEEEGLAPVKIFLYRTTMPDGETLTAQPAGGGQDGVDFTNAEKVTDGLGNPVFIELSANNGWTGTFYDLPKKDPSGKTYFYKIAEEPVPEGFEVSYVNQVNSGEGNAAVINRRKGQAELIELPETGGCTPELFVAAGGVLTGMSAALAGYGNGREIRRRRRKNAPGGWLKK